MEDGDDLERLTPRERFLRAKVEHYFERAEECVRMARYSIAQKFVEKVLGLEPEHAGCKNLKTLIDAQLLKIAQRSNGTSRSDAPADSAHPRRRKSELVLVVDQDENLLASLCAALHHYGFEVVSAASYEEAVDTLSLIVPDVVISEVNFESGARGFDLYHWLKTHLNEKDIPFLFLAARIDRETLIAGKRFGVDDFILKPVDDEVITASVVNCLARRKSAVVQA
jgi:PleD family two-component response regulator